MKPIVFDDIHVSLRAADIAPTLHVEPGTDDYDDLERLLGEACAIARPKAVYTTAYVTGRGEDAVEIDGLWIESRVMSENLKNVHRVFPYVATCGTEVDDWSAGITDFLQNWWMDVAKAHLLYRATRRLNDHLKQDLKLGNFANMNPGSLPNWPITGQAGLFGLIGDVKALIGVTLTDSMLMIPSKSVSGFYFQTESSYENCELCTREGCPGRRKPLDRERYQQLLGAGSL